MKFIIEGGNELHGKIKVAGNKNSVFPCVAAALLTDEEVILENIPNIRDTNVLIEILENLGVQVNKVGNILTIKAETLQSELPKELMTRLRGSIALVGAILGRTGKVEFYHPGGDVIGKRGIEAHLEGFKSLGAKLEQNDLKYKIKFVNKPTGKLDIFLPERSVTGTENLILACAMTTGVITLRNCASEPHIRDLCNMLLQMGVKIEGIGSDTLTIHGVEKLKGTKFRICADYIEIGTYAIAAAITKGEIILSGLDNSDLDPILFPLRNFGIIIERKDDTIKFKAEKIQAVSKLTTNVWPGFPTDLMSPVLVLATQAHGITLCHDWMFESRFFFSDKLLSMGANITIADPHRVLVYGPTRLKGRELESPDIRAGMTLVLAGLIAKGQSVINKAELIERGYEDVVTKLKSLGAKIESID